MDIVLLIVAWVLVVAGTTGIFIPMVPGVPLLWVALLILAWVSDFTVLSGTVIVVTGVLMLIAQGVDYVAGTLGAKAMGATTRGVMGAFVGVIVGLLTLGPLGIIIGPFVGALLAELMAGRSERAALRAGMGTLVGFLGGTFIQMLYGMVLLGYFVYGFIALLVG